VTATAAAADLRLLGITKRYGGAIAVDAVSLDVPPGEFLTLLGPSGCGKTTLLKCIAGFVVPTAGQVVLRGEVVNDILPHLRNIGIVFQHYALFPHLTAAENIAFGLRMRKRPRAEIARRVAEMLRLVKLPGLGDRYPHQLSGGQQQRVALARVLAVEPVLLLLDEPFGALDKKLRIEMQIEVKQLVTSLRITTLFVTHDQEEAMRMSDRVAVMNAGRIVQCAAPAIIYDRPATLFVADFIGASNLLPAKVLGRASTRVRAMVAGTEIDLPPGVGGPVSGEAVVMIRPENLALDGEPGAGRPSWRGRVTFALHAGPTMEYEIAVGDSWRFRVSRPRLTESGRLWQVGDQVTISVQDPAAVVLFGTDT
jgi:putative spermidine/putrescine transport system ATP-binding protein